jgi:dolichyl-phosphate beta-glucosyltransferase
MSKLFVSIIIPSYNEMQNLKKGILDKVSKYLSSQKYEFEVIIVDDGSDDGSREFVKEFVSRNKKFRLLENDHTGKAGAVTKGVLSATGDYILFTDMDQATPIEELEKLLPFIPEYDIVVGSRSNNRSGAPFSRKIMANGMIILRTLLVGLSDIRDTQCGFKLFSKEAAKKVFSTYSSVHNGFKSIKNSSVTAGFDIELLYIGERFGYSVKEVPIRWFYVETRRVSPLRDSIEGLLELFKIRSRIIKKVYQR